MDHTAHPLLLCVSREARALRQTATAYTRLSFVVVSGMVLTLLGGLLLNLDSTQSGGIPVPPMVFLIVMCGAVIIAICTLFESRESTKTRPKDASPLRWNH